MLRHPEGFIEPIFKPHMYDMPTFSPIIVKEPLICLWTYNSL